MLTRDLYGNRSKVLLTDRIKGMNLGHRAWLGEWEYYGRIYVKREMSINFRVNRFLMGYLIFGFSDILKINVSQIARYFIYTLLGKFCGVEFNGYLAGILGFFVFPLLGLSAG